MTTQGYGVNISKNAGADLSAHQFKAVKLDSNGNVVLCGNGELGLGVLQNNPGNGQTATVRISGVSKMVASGVIGAGVAIGSDANGKAKAAVAGRTNTSDAGSATDALIGSYAMGLTTEAATADGQIIGVLIQQMGALPTTAA